jgi:uncharacterized protein (TIGR02466 family)
MKTNYIDAFPTLVHTVEDVLNKEQCESIREYILLKQNLMPHGLLPGGGVSNYVKDLDFLDEITSNIDNCSHLKTNINFLLEEYSNYSGIEHTVIDRSWANFQPKGSRLLEHMHPGSFITGALYISCDQATPLILNNPNPFLNYTHIGSLTKYTNTNIIINPTPGMVVLFPSWILHATDTSYAEERIVVSFNSGLK